MTMAGHTQVIGHRREYMPGLDGLRGIAALMVALGHAKLFGFDPIIRKVGADYGVFIFFVLSGFLMGDLYLPARLDTSSAKTFMISRLARILPMYYSVSFLSFYILTFVDPDFIYKINVVQLFRLLTFVSSISVFWSIGPEVQFYAVFLMLWMIHTAFRSKLPFVLTVTSLGVLCILSVSLWPGISIMSKFHIFGCGLLFAALRLSLADRVPDRVIISGQIASVLVVLLFAFSARFDAFLGGSDYDPVKDPAFSIFYGSLGRTLLSGLVVFFLSYTSRLGLVLFANPFTVMLGKCSFSIYLLNEIGYSLLSRSGLLQAADGRIGTIVCVSLVIGASYASYRLLELPLRRQIRNFLTSPRPVRGLESEPSR